MLKANSNNSILLKKNWIISLMSRSVWFFISSWKSDYFLILEPFFLVRRKSGKSIFESTISSTFVLLVIGIFSHKTELYWCIFCELQLTFFWSNPILGLLAFLEFSQSVLLLLLNLHDSPISAYCPEKILGIYRHLFSEELYHYWLGWFISFSTLNWRFGIIFSPN